MTTKDCARCVLFLALGLSTLALNSSAQTNQKTIDWGAPVNGLQMAISLGSTASPSPTPAVTLHLRNVGQNWADLLLGGNCAVSVLGPSEVSLNLTDASGKSNRLIYVGPGPPWQLGQFACAGIWSPWIVPLPPGGKLSIPLKLDDYRESPLAPSGNGDFERGWQPGCTYTLQAQFYGPTRTPTRTPTGEQHFWQGTVLSNKLQIHFPGP
jgi:hypothetical protein